MALLKIMKTVYYNRIVYTMREALDSLSNLISHANLTLSNFAKLAKLAVNQTGEFAK
jgi:hypothetical protein